MCQRCPCSTHRVSLIQIPAAHLLVVREVLLLARKWGRRLGNSCASALLAAGTEAHVAPLVLFTRIHDLKCVGATTSSWMRRRQQRRFWVQRLRRARYQCTIAGADCQDRAMQEILAHGPDAGVQRLVQKVVRRRQRRRRLRRVSRILRLVVCRTFRSTLERQRRGGPIHGSGSIVISCHLPAPCLREKNAEMNFVYVTSTILASIHTFHSISRARSVPERTFEPRVGRTPVGVRT